MITQPSLLNLRVTVDGTPYNVQVEVLPSNNYASAASRVEGAAVGPALPRPKLTNLPRGGSRSAPPPQASTPAAPPAVVIDEPRAAPAPPRAPWHNLTLGKPGECLSPVPAIIREVFVKVGDKVSPSDPLFEIQVAARISPQDAPSVGTIRAVTAGVVTQIHVHKNDAVAVNQLLISFTPA